MNRQAGNVKFEITPQIIRAGVDALCSNDLLAIRSLRAAHLSGLQVPTDLTITGFDGIALGLDTTPTLSTIAQPNHDIGRSSVELLVQSLASNTKLQAGNSVKLNYFFRDGESCGPAPLCLSESVS